VRILHLSDRLTDRGGAHVHLRGVIEAQVERGHSVRLLAGQADPGFQPACEVGLLPGLEARARLSVDLDAVVADFAADLIHLHTVVNPAVLEAAARWRALISVQDHRYFCPARGKWTAAGEVCRTPMEPEACGPCFEDRTYATEILALTRERLQALRGLDAVVLSRYMRGELVAAGLAAERVHVIPPFVHGLDAAASPDGPPCVLFVGRLSETKGPFEAWEAWRRSGVELPLLFAGTGPLRAGLEARGAQVLGWQDRSSLSRLLRRARALLLPSRWQEPFGIAGLEARSFGVPVVAWASGGVPEWCDPETLVPWGDIDGLAATLSRAVAGAPADLPSGFDREGRIDAIESLYRRILEEAAR